MIDEIANAICDHLIERLVRSPYLLAEGNVFIGGPQEEGETGIATQVPDRCVFIVPTGGFRGQSLRDGKDSLERPTFQILIRVPPNATDGLQLAGGCHAALTFDAPQGVIDCVTMQPPAFVSTDQQGRMRFSFNVMLTVERRTFL